MKKYIVVFKNSRKTLGSYQSREEASAKLMEFINDVNNHLNADYLSLFDFDLEEVECNEVNEVITDYDSAIKYLVGNTNDDFIVDKERFSKSVVKIKKAEKLIKELNPKHIEALVALNELFTIAEAWNKADGFVPDFSDLKQKSGFLGSRTTKMLRGSCVRIRMTLHRMRLRLSVVFASRPVNAPNNSASNSPNFITMFYYNT